MKGGDAGKEPGMKAIIIGGGIGGLASALALVGDAAHAMTPNLGQGAGQALEDAVVLARCLDGGGGLDAYDRLRHPAPRRSRCARTGWGWRPSGHPPRL
jgi:FAD binding domain